MESEIVIKDNMELITYKSFTQRLIEIWRESYHENYFCEIFIPFLKMCCINDTKLVPVFNDRATGSKTVNDTDYKKRMKIICADKGNGQYVVPDYIFVPSSYTFFKPEKPYLMVETKKPVLLKDGECYRNLKDSIEKYKDELDAEINASAKGYLLYTDGITWMFLKHEDNKIVESKEYPTITLADKSGSYYKANYITFKKGIKRSEHSNMGEEASGIEIVPEEWNKLQEQIKKLLGDIVNK